MPRKFIHLLVLFLALFVQTASAQFSISAGSQYVFENKNRLPLLGLEAKLAVDVTDNFTIGFLANQLGFIQWEYVEQMDFGFGAVSMNVPFRVGSENPLVEVKVNEFTLLTTYYFAGCNTSVASAYGSAGPGLRYYRAIVKNEANPTIEHTEKASDIILDMRVGGQLWVGIGWVFLEAKAAPAIIFPDRADYYEHNRNPFLAANIGLRFLLNPHPRCKLQ